METYYIVYKTTNRINGRTYIGCHKTVNLKDGYLGSGIAFKLALKKYGVENFEREILEIFDNSEDMFEREYQLVDHLSEYTYNLIEGGSRLDYTNVNGDNAGARYINSNGLNNTSNQYRISSDKIKSDPGYAEWFSSRVKEGQKNSDYIPGSFRGKTHSVKTKDKMSRIAKDRLSDPCKNSQYGTIWITDGVINKKLNKDGDIPDGWRRGRQM
jgi:hypothetical protein